MIKTCFIASAGFGTRMGELGKVIPKPLWPFLNLKMLDLQVAYARNLGCENIYINSHHCHEEMLDWAKDKNVTLLYEPEILGSGGCIHNLKKVVDNEIILIINSDQFYFFDFENIKSDYYNLERCDAVAHLYAINVDGNSSYNETVLKDGHLIDIIPHEGSGDYFTYSGVGLINLGKVNYTPGSSGFFKTVCDYKSSNVLMSLPDNPVFLDLGTLDKYLSVISKLDEIPDVIVNFLKGIPELDTSDFKSQKKMTWCGVTFDFENKLIKYNGASYSF
ncbi:nucleotidyl transferase domain protein [Halobacteriovorax sp. BALOs_7]|uniref:nucleotidyltransferase family protein n=1 Tax=Halobacteriovorax sp. BALOs_7 TaxID=2109558 RepID=UPI000EB6627A|nr:sugar phosphate nucleotidyltransferase [Halobacteriovorax sp. BALOs_7]AYF45972.1 nucleotidyl transferase domain protein [Halobacteriovorax sp. BALOs_7]